MDTDIDTRAGWVNPAEKEIRNRDADLVILGIMSMYHEIKRQLGEE